MSSNERILYSCQSVSLTKEGDDGIAEGDIIHGLQSVGMTTSFNLEQAFELGQLEIYENIEGTPDVEVTLEKVLDGYPLIYLMASTGVTNTSASGLIARSKEKCDLRLGIFGEEFNNVASATDNGGKSEVEVYCSGMNISSVSYNFSTDGNATESVTLVGNNKRWLTGSDVKILDASVANFDGEDSPLALGVAGSASGGIQRREDVLMPSSILPRSIYPLKSASASVGNAVDAEGNPLIHVQSFSVSTDFSREDILELGRKTPYARPATFPIEVSCEIEAISTSGDFVDAFEFGDAALYGTVDSGNNTQSESIFLALRGGMTFDLGTKNRLASVSYGGGDATGGNATSTYSFTNFNELEVRQVGHNSVATMGPNGTDIGLYQ